MTVQYPTKERRNSPVAEQIVNFITNLLDLYSDNLCNPNLIWSHEDKSDAHYTNPLSHAIRSHDWEGTLIIIKGNPSLAGVTSSRGMTPLHIACEAGAPKDVIKLLLEANPGAARTKCGKQDRLPLHYHLASRASTPSESIVSLLINSYPESTRVGDACNGLPIHLACQASNVSLNIFAMLLSSFPKGACARDFRGNYPLDYANWNEDVVTKEIALVALVQNDATEMRRSLDFNKSFSNPKLELLSRDGNFKRKRSTKEVNFSIFDDEYELQ
jgi:ankyrin repeat protein